VNSRLDEVQAAILRARLPRLRAWTDARRRLASVYRAALHGAPVVVPPEVDAGHVYHLFAVRSGARAELQAHLAGRGVDTLIHYPVPLPRQAAFRSTSPADCPIAAAVCDEVLSLPLHPRLTEDEVRSVAAAVAAFERTDECVR
jgi:dTDP-4-amino-4,6-dideoxygalactose transaminase